MYCDDRLQAHFAPKPLVIVKGFHFQKSHQEDEQSVAQFVAVLKRLSEHCEFDAHLEDVLRDRFACGLNGEERCRGASLMEENLMFQKACMPCWQTQWRVTCSL